jgi:two-component sensor histidine kinase
MVAVHEHIYRSDQYARVDVSDYVPKLVQNLKESYGNDVDLVCEIAPIEVDRDHALPLGLIVNEVVSNAMKHAFKDGRKGRIILSLERKEGARGELTIRDNGVGFDPSQETTGMGSRLIRGLVSQLDAEHEFSSDGGTIFVLRFPILDVAAD